MGVYIKGMEMPKKQVIAVINPNGLVEILNSDNILIEEFEAIPVPPHGRCIDADALVMENYTQYGAIDALALEAIKAAPTILEAEEKKL